MLILEVSSRQPSPVTHGLYILEEGVRMETEALSWDSSAVSVTIKLEVLANLNSFPFETPLDRSK